MSHIFRFMAERLSPGRWLIDPEERHHIEKVLKLEPGTPIELGDGKGWVGRLALPDRKSLALELEPEELFVPAKDRTKQLTLAIGALKPQSLDDILPGLIELGADQIWVFASQSVDKSRLQDKLRERWQRIAWAALKQCKRAWLPELNWFTSLTELGEKTKDFAFCSYFSADAKRTVWEAQASIVGPALVVIGSEKGLDRQEEIALEHLGCQGLRLEAPILRATTAAIAAASLYSQILAAR